MAASGYTPILIYASGTASNVPLAANLTSSASGAELALNYADGKLYYKDSGGTVRLLASQAASSPVTSFSAGTTGLTPNTATTGAITLAGTLATTNGGTGLTSFTSGGAVYATSTSALTTGTLPVTAGGTGLATLTANYIPYGNGTSAFQSNSGFTFNGTTLVAPAASLSISALTSSNTSNFQIGGTLSFSDTGIINNMVGNTNSYLQSVLQNTNAGSAASAEYIVYNNNGTASTNFATFGINSSGYTGTGSINAAGYSYFLSGSTDIVVGTIGANAIHLTVNSGATDAMSISSAGLINVNSNTAGNALLTVTTSTSKSSFKTANIAEVDTISATAATGTINFDITTQSVLYYTSNAAANWTVNFRGSSGTSLDSLMATGESISATFLVTQGSTAYYNSAVTIDGASVTPKWQGGTAPTSGNASSVDCYTYVIQKTGSATFTVLASQTKFA